MATLSRRYQILVAIGLITLLGGATLGRWAHRSSPVPVPVEEPDRPTVDSVGDPPDAVDGRIAGAHAVPCDERGGDPRCTGPAVLRPLDIEVSGIVQDMDGRGRVWVEGCGVTAFHANSQPDPRDGSFFLRLPAASCAIRACRGTKETAGSLCGPPVDVEEGDQVVTLMVPAAVPAGIGVQFSPEFPVVVHVQPGGGAADAGIPEGALVLAVDGVPVSQHWEELADFLEVRERIMGVPGSLVRLTLEVDGIVRDVDVGRAPVPIALAEEPEP